MPTVQGNGIDIYYEVQGEGEPIVLIPYLAADQACYAFQVAEYAKHFRCFTVDLRGAGLSGKPEGTYTTELLAEDIAAFMQAANVERAHVFGLSLGAATGMWLAAKHPARVKSLSLHSAWDRTDPFLRVVVESWRIMARGLGSVTDAVIAGIFPYCFTPELYAARPEYIDSLADFVRGRPMPPVDAFLRQSEAALGHDACGVLERDPGADPHHVRPPRHLHVDPFRRAAHRGDQGLRGHHLRGLRPRPDLRERRGVQRPHAGVHERTADSGRLGRGWVMCRHGWGRYGPGSMAWRNSGPEPPARPRRPRPGMECGRGGSRPRRAAHPRPHGAHGE